MRGRMGRLPIRVVWPSDPANAGRGAPAEPTGTEGSARLGSFGGADPFELPEELDPFAGLHPLPVLSDQG